MPINYIPITKGRRVHSPRLLARDILRSKKNGRHLVQLMFSAAITASETARERAASRIKSQPLHPVQYAQVLCVLSTSRSRKSDVSI